MKKISLFISATALLFASCKSQNGGKFEFLTPDAGLVVTKGQQIDLQLKFPSSTLDSVVYAIDGNAIFSKQDTNAIRLDTQLYGYGSRSLSAKMYSGGKEEIAYSNIVIVPEKAKNYSFEVVNAFPHDSEAFTQGLEYEDGYLYESTGLEGYSTLRKVDLNTGKVLQKIDLASSSFGEGMTIMGNKIIQLTWLEKVGFVYDKNTFEKIGSFDYQNSKEGWGIAYDGQNLIKSDGSNNLYILDPHNNYIETKVIPVFDENGPVDMLNELEYIDGKIYANVYQKDIIVIINPETGAVEGRINFIGLYDHPNQEHEFNGIAYDRKGKRLFVTGKKWPKLYEVKVIAR